MRRFDTSLAALLFLCSSVFLFGSGCTASDSDDSDDGEETTRDTGTCNLDRDVGDVAVACGPGSGSATGGGGSGSGSGGGLPGSGSAIGGDASGSSSDRTIIGTCFDHDQETPICEESWASGAVTNTAGIEDLRDNAGKNCLDGEPENEWTRAEDVCPKDDGYLGTCKFQTRATYSEHSWYSPAETADAKEGCERLGGDWVVE